MPKQKTQENDGNVAVAEAPENQSTYDPMEGVGEMVDLGKSTEEDMSATGDENVDSVQDTVRRSKAEPGSAYRTKRLDNSLELEHGATPATGQRRFWIPLTVPDQTEADLKAIAASHNMNVRSYLIWHILTAVNQPLTEWRANAAAREDQEKAAKEEAEKAKAEQEAAKQKEKEEKQAAAKAAREEKHRKQKEEQEARRKANAEAKARGESVPNERVREEIETPKATLPPPPSFASVSADEAEVAGEA